MFTHLHVHTEYSLLDGMCKIPALLAKAKALGMDSLAITDHGAMYGVIDFYLAAKEAGVKPIVGMEAYVAPLGCQSRTPADKNPYHLILLAKNETGYRNLIQLTTKAHLDGFYYRPRVDRAWLEDHAVGLVALSGCTQGEVPRLLREDRQEEAERAARWYQEVFGDFCLELQDHTIPQLPALNRALVDLGRRLDIPLVATNDVHYVEQADAPAHDLLLCIQTNTTIYDEKRMRMPDDSFYLKSPQEMKALWQELPQALGNSQRIAEMCHLNLEFNRLHLPEIDIPAGMTPDGYLAKLCWEGISQRYASLTEPIKRRLEYELEVVRKTEFANYFLVVWDMICFARRQGILFGVRGSAAASIVLYSLGVTDINPLAHNLVFERFLNMERKEMPDIDMDFQDDRRDEMIAYVSQKYGSDHVAQIITFGTLGTRAAMRDVGRALGMSYGDVDRVARLVPPALNMTIARALRESPELDTLYHQDSAVRQLIESATKLEGIARHASTHAAGVVISKDPLTEHVPLQRPVRAETGDTVMTQYAMENIAQIGLLKMDLLGLGNLTILERTRQMIAKNKGVHIDLQHFPLDDPKTYALLSAGETTGVFQLEGAGMRRHIKELKPSSFKDIAAIVALYRPGPMQHIPTFIRAKHGLEPIRYPHPALASILEDTYGVIVYQDQVLFIVQTFAGYSLGQADVVRKAMGKKIPEVMREERRHFLEGAKGKGFSEAVANQVFDLIEPFAGYAFNKAHSVSYATIAYQTAYLKANYPAEYMSALLTMNMGQSEKVASAVAECRRLGIAVLPPDVNHSDLAFTVERIDEGAKEAVRFGLEAIKNVGRMAVQPIVEERQRGGSFASVEDLCRRADLRGLNKRAWESLIKAGALDGLGARSVLLSNVDKIVALAQREQRRRESGQAAMFDLWGALVAVPLPGLELGAETASAQEKLAWEKEMLGVFLSEHPFSQAAKDLEQAGTVFCGQIGEDMVGQNVVVAGMVTSLRSLLTREGKPFVSVILEDLDGSVEVTCWPQAYERTREVWAQGNILLVRGRVRPRNDSVQVVCEAARLYQSTMVGTEGLLAPEEVAAFVAAGSDQRPFRSSPTNDAERHTGNGSLATPSLPRGYGNHMGQRNAPKPNGKPASADGPRKDAKRSFSPSAAKMPLNVAAPRATSSPTPRELFITFSPSTDVEADMVRLQNVVNVLRSYAGQDVVHLSIVNGGQATRLEVPSVRVNCCPELLERLAALVGQQGLQLA